MVRTIDDLPPEVLKEIADFCSFSTLKSLRLVNQRFTAVSTPKVFEHVILVLHGESLAKLSEIARSRLAGNVRKLSFWLHRLVSVDLEHFQQERTDQFAPDRKRQSVTRHCFDIWKEQQKWYDAVQGRILANSISQLSGLCELNLLGTNANHDIDDWPLWNYIKGARVVHKSYEIWEDWSGASSSEVCTVLPILEGLGRRSELGQCEPLTALRSELAHIVLHQYLNSRTSRQLLDPNAIDERLAKALIFVKHLRKLVVPFTNIDSRSQAAYFFGHDWNHAVHPNPEQTFARGLECVLRNAPELRHLEISKGSSFEPPSIWKIVEPIFDPRKQDASICPRLKTLKVFDPMESPPQLEKIWWLWIYHRASLKRLTVTVGSDERTTVHVTATANSLPREVSIKMTTRIWWSLTKDEIVRYVCTQTDSDLATNHLVLREVPGARIDPTRVEEKCIEEDDSDSDDDAAFTNHDDDEWYKYDDGGEQYFPR